jgi:aspartate racemase
MKTLGLIGGTTWVSTVDYYKYINRLTNERAGGAEAARLILYSANFAELMAFVNADDWDGVGRFLAEIAVRLERAGAEAVMLCANTTHIVADVVQQAVSVPLLHIVDAVAKEVAAHEIKKVGLLGTRFTMEREFFKDGLARYHIETVVPTEADRTFVHDSIYNEFGKNVFKDETRQEYRAIIDRLSDMGAGGVILGCTEIPMLIKPEECGIQGFDTTFIHAKYAVDFAFA